MAYYNANDDLTNRFDNPNFNSQLLNGSHSEDASTTIYGGGGQIAFRPDAANLVTVALDARHEGWEADGFEMFTGNQAAARNPCPPERRLSDNNRRWS